MVIELINLRKWKKFGVYSSNHQKIAIALVDMSDMLFRYVYGSLKKGGK